MRGLKRPGEAREFSGVSPFPSFLSPKPKICHTLTTRRSWEGEKFDAKIQGSRSVESVTFKRPPWPGPPPGTTHAPTAIEGREEKHPGGGGATL